MVNPFARRTTPIVATPIMAPTLPAVRQQAQRAMVSGAAMIEWRVDGLTLAAGESDAATALAQQIKQRGQRLLVTLRTKQQGGQGSATDYARQVQAWCARLQPDAVDVEFGPATAPLMTALQPVPIVLSWHDFAQTPTDAALQQRMQAMAARKPALVKLALMPQTPADVLRILTLSQWAQATLDVPFAIMGMGNLGRITRVAGRMFGSVLTFASAGVSSAPGQMPVALVQQLLNEFGE